MKLVFITALNFTQEAQTLIERSLYCYRIEADIPVEARIYNQSLGIGYVICVITDYITLKQLWDTRFILSKPRIIQHH